MDEEIKIGQEVMFKKRTNWHPALVLGVYENPRALSIQCRKTGDCYIVKPEEIATDLGFKAKKPGKRKEKPSKQLSLL